MKHILRFIKENKYILLISFFFFIFRLFKLDQTNLLHDERDIFISGYALSKTGQDITGKSFPLMFYEISAKNPLLAIYFNALISFFVPLKSVFFARFIYVALTSVLPYLIFKFVEFVTKNKKAGYLTAIVWCTSPWVFHAMRLGFEVNLAFVLLFIALNLYLRGQKLWGYVFFALLTYAYSGTRVLIPFALIFAELWHFLHYKNWKKFLFIIGFQLFFSVILLGSTVVIEPEMTADRAKNEIVFFNTAKIAPEVDFKRTTSSAPELVKKLVSNKLTVSFDYILTTFTLGIDSSHLFKKGDNSPINGNTASGEFLPVFLVFYYLGFMYLGRKLKKEVLYPLGIIMAGMSPALVNSLSPSFGIRAVTASVGFSYLIALGLLLGYELYEKWSKKLRFAVGVIFIGAVVLSVGYFYYNFFERRFTLVSELFNEHERQLSERLIETNKPVTVYSENPRELFYSYFFFNKDMTVEQLQKEVKKKNNTYRAGNIVFLTCPSVKTPEMLKQSIFSSNCFGEKNYERLSKKAQEKIGLIPYHDISTKQAYYIFE